MVAIVWSENYTGQNQIWCTTSTDHGASFSDTVQISDSPIGAIQPDVAISDSGVHVVWMDFQLEDPEDTTTYDSWHLFYKRDSDFDNVWDDEDSTTFVDFGPNVMESTYNDYMWEPSILAESRGGMVVVSMQPSVVGTRISIDGGKSWSDGVLIRGERKRPVNVDCSRLGNNAGVTWCDQTDTLNAASHNWEVFYASSDSIGKNNWPIFKRLSSDTSYSIQPTIDSDADKKVYVAWADNLTGVFRIFFRKGYNMGRVWSQTSIIPAPLGTGAGGAWQPDLVWDRMTINDAHLVWVDYTEEGRGRLYYSFYDGANWDEPDTASVPPPDGSVFRPDFAIDDDGNTFVVWTDVTDSTSIVKSDQDPSNP